MLAGFRSPAAVGVVRIDNSCRVVQMASLPRCCTTEGAEAVCKIWGGRARTRAPTVALTRPRCSVESKRDSAQVGEGALSATTCSPLGGPCADNSQQPKWSVTVGSVHLDAGFRLPLHAYIASGVAVYLPIRIVPTTTTSTTTSSTSTLTTSGYKLASLQGQYCVRICRSKLD